PGNHESAGKKKYTNAQGQPACENSFMRSGVGRNEVEKIPVGGSLLENGGTLW
ncbi:hypothetical protein PPOP_3453, partial [Paenibacillus popilliae ATCC 14706]